MADFDHRNIEIQDEIGRDTEHYNGSVTTAGSPVTVSTSSANPIQFSYILNPSKGTNANDPTDLLYVSWDGTNYTVIPRGGYIMWPGKGFGTSNQSIKIDSNANGTNYEVMLVS
jgi:hypothetical protein